MIWYYEFFKDNEIRTISLLRDFIKESTAPGQTSRLRNYTLHNDEHFNSIIENAHILLRVHTEPPNNIILCEAGELFLFFCSVYLHDIDMYTYHKEEELIEILKKKPSSTPITIGEIQRKFHNDLASRYIDENFDKLRSLGIQGGDLALIKDICRLHRGPGIDTCKNPIVKKVAVLLRICDELDIGPKRAPLEYFKNNFQDMDFTAQRHWVKHIVTSEWMLKRNVFYELNNIRVIFNPVCNCPNQLMNEFVLNQIMIPITKELDSSIIRKLLAEIWGIEVEVNPQIDFCGKVSWGDCHDIINNVLIAWENEYKRNIAQIQSLSIAHHDQKRSQLNPGDYFRPSDYPLSGEIAEVPDKPFISALINKYASTLGAVPATPENAGKLEAIWVSPNDSDSILTGNLRMDTLPLQLKVPSEPLFRIHSNKKNTNSIVLKSVASEFLQWAKSCRSSNGQMIIFGERGSGKTITIGSIFIVNREYFRKNKIFWLRLDMFKDVAFNTIWDEKKIVDSAAINFFNIIFNTKYNYFSEFSKIKLLNPKLFYNTFPLDGPSNSIKLWNQMKGLANSKKWRGDFFHNFIQVMFEKNFSFIFIYDNIDQVEHVALNAFDSSLDKNLQTSISNLIVIALNKKYNYVPSFNIIVCRGNTLNKYLPLFLDTRLFRQDSFRTIGRVNAGRVLRKRLEYIKNGASIEKEKPPLRVRSGSTKWAIKEIERLIEIMNEFVLVPSEPAVPGNECVVGGISGSSISNLLEMVKDLLSSFVIEDRHLLKGYFGNQTLIKQHHVLWALMLRGNRLYYSSKFSFSRIFNVYDNYNDRNDFIENAKLKSSPMLKRVLLEFFTEGQGQRYRNIAEIRHYFLSELGFDPKDLEISLNEMVRWSLLRRFQDAERLDRYGITNRGIFFKHFVQNQYIYHELVLEDTLLPNEIRQFLYIFKYKPYENKVDYFKKKVPMVRKFVSYLDEEETNHLESINRPGWSENKRLIQPLICKLKKQEIIIADSLKIPINDLEGTWGSFVKKLETGQ